jgi:hypothetical protein
MHHASLLIPLLCICIFVCGQALLPDASVSKHVTPVWLAARTQARFFLFKRLLPPGSNSTQTNSTQVGQTDWHVVLAHSVV